MKQQTDAIKRSLPRPKRYTTVVMILLIISAVAGSLFAGFSENSHNRDFLKGRAAIIADALPVNDISQLKGNTSDLKLPAYQHIKDRLEQIRRHNQDIRFVYLMGKKPDGKVFFYVDSEIPSSANYSPPGEGYTEASGKLKSVFVSDSPIIEGPVTDRRGVWVSAIAPVIDAKSGAVVAVAGIDTPAFSYYTQILIYALIPLCLAAIPLAGLLRDRKLEAKEWEITQLKNQFVSIASHELRSPLNGMLWAIQSLLKPNVTNLTEKQRELLTDMFRSSESSVTTINEILDLSIFERTTLDKFRHETVDLVAVVSEVIKTLSLGAQEKHLSIVMNPGQWPAKVTTTGDTAALRRAFMNIISNSIKYSYGGTTIKIGYNKDNAGRHVITVSDEGIGIPTAEQTKVLEGYYRAGNAKKVQAHGTGLGLWLTKLVVEEHGGTVSVKSKEAEGTTVTITLPPEHGEPVVASIKPANEKPATL